MRLVEDQHPVEELASQGADGVLADRIHPGSLNGGPQDPDAASPEDGVEGPGEVRSAVTDLARRVTVGTVLTAPGLFGVMARDFFHPAWLRRFSPTPGSRSPLIGPVMLYTGRPIHRTGWLGPAHFSPDMNSLVTLGATATFAYSLVITLTPSLAPVKLRGSTTRRSGSS